MKYMRGGGGKVKYTRPYTGASAASSLLSQASTVRFAETKSLEKARTGVEFRDNGRFDGEQERAGVVLHEMLFGEEGEGYLQSKYTAKKFVSASMSRPGTCQIRPVTSQGLFLSRPLTGG